METERARPRPAPAAGPPWVERFEGLRQLPPGTREELLARSRVVTLPAGTTVFGPGREPDSLLFLIDGTVRVSQTSETGREIVLYRVEAGESCVMTTACLLAHEAYTAEGIAETDIRAAAVPRAAFDHLLATSRDFREVVFATYARRITDLFRVIDDVAFGRMDVRLAHRLTELSEGDADLLITHQALATELGTAREVISRQLHEFQKRGLIAQARGRITLLDRAALARLGEQ